MKGRAVLGRVGGLLALLFLALAGVAFAQGASAIIWSRADGAGCLAFSKDGRLLAYSGRRDHHLPAPRQRWRAGPLDQRESGNNAVAFSPDGQFLAGPGVLTAPA